MMDMIRKKAGMRHRPFHFWQMPTPTSTPTRESTLEMPVMEWIPGTHSCPAVLYCTFTQTQYVFNVR